MKVLLLVLMVTLVAGSVRAQLTHDVSVDSMLTYSSAPIGAPFPQMMWVINRGVDTERSVPISCVTTDPNGNVVYRDTAFVTLPPAETQLVRFPDFTPMKVGNFRVCGTSMLATDQNHSNDALCQTSRVGWGRDMQMLAIVTPKKNDSIVYTTGVRARAQFRNIGSEDGYFVPVRLEVRRTTDGQLFFRADTTIEAVDADSSVFTCIFPIAQGQYDSRKLAVGQ